MYCSDLAGFFLVISLFSSKISFVLADLHIEMFTRYQITEPLCSFMVFQPIVLFLQLWMMCVV